MRFRIKSSVVGAILLVLTATVPFGSAMAHQESTPVASPETAPSVVREVLSSAETDDAPGEIFELARYTIAPHAVLPVHTHPGTQMAVVISGTLTYHVVENGSITVTRADGTVEIFGPGETSTMEIGDSWDEPEGMIHYAENLTDEPVVLMSSSLLTEGVPTSEIVEDVATPAN